MVSEFEAFVTGLLTGAILRLWESLAKLAAVALSVAAALAVTQTVTEEGLTVAEATRYWYTYLLSAARYYWPTVVGFALGMFAGALARRGR